MENVNEDLENLLRDRAVSEEIIHYLKDENIDAHSLLAMNEQKLSELFPKYGDRVAILDFCKRATNGTFKRKQGLLAKLRAKMKLKRHSKETEKSDESSDDTVSPTKKLSDNKIKGKANRMIELGWLNWDGARYVQVRAKFGGGTRKVIVPKTANKEYLMEKSKTLFFPNGVSSKGGLEQFTVNLFDFAHNVVPESLTVHTFFEDTAITRLRFYLATVKLPEYQTATEVSAVRETSAEIQMVAGTPPVDTNVFTHTHELLNILEDGTNGNITENSTFLNDAIILQDNQYYNSQYQSIQNLISETETPDYYSVATEEIAIPNINETIKLKLHRGRVFDEMLNAFTMLDKNFGPLSIEMILPNGETERAVDTGGVFRDCLSEFWTTFYEKCTVGTKLKIPYLRHDFQADKWKSVAKILYKGWKNERYLPIELAPPFLEYCCAGKFQSDLVFSFFQYISASDAEILTAALNDFSAVENSEISDVLENFDCKWVPSATNITTIVQDIAHKELIQRPMYVIDCFSNILSGLIGIEELGEIYKGIQPTPKNIISMLTYASELDNDMTRVLEYLKKYIREAEANYRKSFLRFCTGADIVLQKQISIEFVNVDGFGRNPIAHTCNCLLELPISYHTFPDFRSEFNSILNSNIWIMDAI